MSFRPILQHITTAATDGLASASSASNSPKGATVEDSQEFIRSLAAMMSYRETPSNFFSSKLRRKYPIAETLSRSSWSKILKGINNRRRSSQSNDESLVLTWARPFSEDAAIRAAESSFSTFFSKLLFTERTILSTDDDQLRLTSTLVEDLGFPRVNNPKKCFGPVATGVVSATTGVVLSLRLSGRGESALQTLKILCLHLSCKPLIEQIRIGNTFALDRGYLSKAMIDFIASIGAKLIGTHKRVMSYPFHFGDIEKLKPGQSYVHEVGAKSIYAAKRTTTVGSSMLAIAYRGGSGSVATLITNVPFLRIESWVLQPKRVFIGDRAEMMSMVQQRIHEKTIPLTSAQGGVDWHIVRSGSLYCTSTLAVVALRAYRDVEFEANETVNGIIPQLLDIFGIRHRRGIIESAPEPHNEELRREELERKTVDELKTMLRARDLMVSGNKPVLVDRLLSESSRRQETDDPLRKLMNKWFMKPVSSSAMKIGSANEEEVHVLYIEVMLYCITHQHCVVTDL